MSGNMNQEQIAKALDTVLREWPEHNRINEHTALVAELTGVLTPLFAQAQAEALRQAARDLGWLGAQGNTVEPDTAWAGVCASRRAIEYKAAAIEAGNAQATRPTEPRTITTAGELDVLPFQSVVLDAYDTPYVCESHRLDGTRNQWRAAGMNHMDESESIIYHGAATVVWEPQS